MEEFDTTQEPKLQSDRRDFLKSCGKYSLTVPPVMTALLSTTLSSPAIAQSGGTGDRGDGKGSKGNEGRGDGQNGDRPRGDNGLGNGSDPQPRGNPPVNDGAGRSPGDPGNRRR